MTLTRGIKTDGIGTRTTGHLNLARTMAAVWRLRSKPAPLPMVVTLAPTPAAQKPEPKIRPHRRKPKTGPLKFAGYDPSEKRLGVHGG